MVEVSAGEAAIEERGQWENVQQRLAVAVDALGGDDISRERLPVHTGSRMTTRRPALSSVCEKSPRRSSSVGIIQFRSAPGFSVRGVSSE